MSGVEPIVLAAALGSVASTGLSLIQSQQGGPDTETLTPARPADDDLTADSETLARRQVQLRRRRGSSSLSIDPATGGPNAVNSTGLSI